jgi:hypothetical protein
MMGSETGVTGEDTTMRTHDEKSTNLWGPLLLAGAAALLSFVGAINLARAVAEMGPNVGDVLDFRPDRGLAVDMDARLAVSRVDQSTCQLDVVAIRRSGGSLIVEQRRPGTPHVYQVHWSGPRTSSDNGDCGTSADLLLKDTDMEVLSMAAGGYGVGHKHLGVASGWGSDSVPVR